MAQRVLVNLKLNRPFNLRLILARLVQPDLNLPSLL